MPASQPAFKPASAEQGFTLVELMVTIAVLAIIASIAVPSMRSLIAANRISATATELVTGVQLARSEATRRNAQVTLCPSVDGQACANQTDWSRWIVTGRDNSSGEVEVLRAFSVPAGMQVDGPVGGIRFRASGMPAAPASLTVCLPVERPADNQRVISLLAGGGVSTEKHNGAGACP
ncbi:GspH/FimT family pseudopilin [Stenotrophomonas mori]|uniref:Type II secretion system protein H n=1 Tax=Stenotrophomonas mori TaxID=2871096 RepID=A0ABT0SFV0_9GAMM|nr:GspH/FimT family pseudopilin [Stenotrophomonas mori]MCL7714196.1 GspH/FimT family pseudopilin [Stenotrophomonas mori]